MRINIDMDGVLAKYMFEVPFEGLFEKHYFKNLPPQKNILEAVKRLNRKYDVHILSAYLPDSDYAFQEKQFWLRKWLPEISESNWILIPCGVSKGNYLKSAGDILIDDYGVNCKAWKDAGGKICKVSSSPADAKKEQCRYDYLINPDMKPEEIVNVVEKLVAAG